MINEPLIVTDKPALELKASLFPLTILKLNTADPGLLSDHLEKLNKQMPNFFQHTPVVLDLKDLSPQVELNFTEIVARFFRFQLIVIGIRNGSLAQQQSAMLAQLAIIPKGSKEDSEWNANNFSKPQAAIKKAPIPSAQSSSNTKLITKPVRSGQQIYAKNGDLIVIASVSHGAELLADGHIHVYGVLRGRALAGTQGDTSARIFCRGLEAELVAIAGFYRVKDDIPEIKSDFLTQIFLDNENVVIESL